MVVAIATADVQSSSRRRFVTEAEFATIRDDRFRYELMGGELIEMAAAGGRHGRLGTRFTVPMTIFAESEDLGQIYEGQTGFVVIETPVTIICPEVSFVRQDRIPPEEEEIGFLHLAPDLAVEVRSPSDSVQDFKSRAVFLLAVGVRLVWAADPDEKTVTVHRLGREPNVLTIADTLDGEDVLPGFSLSVATIFRRIGDPSRKER